MSLRYLSWSSARNICIVRTLAKMGHYPTRKSEKEAWFLSPLRSETQASFSVSLNKNLWFDFGLGEGGNIIDLVMAINKCSAFAAVQSLRENIHFSFCPEKVVPKVNCHQIKKVKTIEHPALIEYLQHRNIPLRVAQTYCKEIWYSLNNTIYFSLGLKNDAGGWELRNKYYKTATTPKTVTSCLNGYKRLLILEGMFDLLSLKVMEKELVCNSDFIVLNSLGNIKKIIQPLKTYPEVFLYLDNDPAGKITAKILLAQYSNTIDQTHTYQNFKDLNEILKSKKPI